MRVSTEHGRAGEEEATRYLSAKGYEILTRNYRSKRGEVDIVARQGDTLVFVEVKMRSSSTTGSGRDYVHRSKQRRIALAAEQYLSVSGWEGPCRFDVIEIQGATMPRLSHIENAFECH